MKNPELADYLNSQYNNLWIELKNSKLFGEHKWAGGTSFTMSKSGTASNAKQNAFLVNLGKKYGSEDKLFELRDSKNPSLNNLFKKELGIR